MTRWKIKRSEWGKKGEMMSAKTTSNIIFGSTDEERDRGKTGWESLGIGNKWQ